MMAIANCAFIAIFLLTNVIDQTNAAMGGYYYDSVQGRHIPFGGGSAGPREDPYANGPVEVTYYDPDSGEFRKKMWSPYE
ncbi:unnamed protein product [Rodentolepis nana]|uniref:Cuticle protein n=1 Tax=Rodentolepis nana TaxID=102285 RepID=A0A0R3T795_RODNA|nr:unnamed protein product [Rodentolepis nana]